MRKLVMPKKVKVGGLYYTVEYPYSFMEESKTGLCEYKDLVIKIAGSYHGKKRSDQAICQTLLHEIMHAIDFAYCGSCLDEDNLDRIAMGLYSFIASNRVDFKGGRPPASVKLLDHKYKVIIKPMDSSHITNYEAGNIIISNYVNEITMFLFVNSVLYLIQCAFSIPGDVLSETVSKALTCGIHQVLVDNDLTKTIKSSLGGVV